MPANKTPETTEERVSRRRAERRFEDVLAKPAHFRKTDNGRLVADLPAHRMVKRENLRHSAE